MAKRVRQMTGFVPARLSIFKLAFSHKSNQAAKDYAQTNNERLEYLGDAVLGTIVAEYLFKKYPNGDEGFLTKMRSKIVKRKSLNYIGDQMGLDVLLAEYNRTRLSSSMLGNAVEALVGAVYLEKGYRATKRFVIQRMLKLYVDMHELETVDDNYKSQLLEYCQKNGMQVTYKLLNKFKQDRRDRFKVAVMVNGKQLSLADDFNKKSAEQLASLRALQKLGLIEKGAPIETGRKAPSKVDRKPTRAKVDRKQKPPIAKSQPKAKAKPKVADEKHAVATITSKRNAEVKAPAPSKRVKAAKQKVVKPQPKPAATTKKSNAAMPPKKLRRNNSRLGRTIWNGIQTSGTGIAVVDSMGFFESTEVKGAKRPTNKKAKASAKTMTAAPTTKKATTKKAAAVRSIDTSKSTRTQVHKSTAPRKRRPVPLRLLTPIVKDASAVMAIDFSELFGLETKSTRKANATSRRSKRKQQASGIAPSKNKKAVQTESEAWEDTPLSLTEGVPVEKNPTASATKKRPTRSRAKKASPAEANGSKGEKLDEWEDTLLEIAPEGNGKTVELPKMYNKSDGKPSTRRKRPQRGANRKKKTEE